MRHGTAGGQVRELDRQRLVAKRGRIGIGKKCRLSNRMSLEITSCVTGLGWSSAQLSPTPSAAQ
ncbi:hypothetical protein IWX85_002990 [Polaromonas sp. CG_9.11]|nr:hypothetical protein [Polaromonas sp. CG_9.11]